MHLYPGEYLIYGVEYPGIREDVPRIRLFANNQMEYRITDHLASVRATLNNTGTVITNTYDYAPFGDKIGGGAEARQGFNSREKDQEVGLFNNGVRKLDDEEGRFTSIDPLWEKFPAWSPYQYGYNNPMTVTDPGGMQGVALPLGGLIGGAVGVGTGVAAGIAAGAGMIGGFVIWGVYRDFNPTPEMVAILAANQFAVKRFAHVPETRLLQGLAFAISMAASISVPSVALLPVSLCFPTRATFSAGCVSYPLNMLFPFPDDLCADFLQQKFQ